MFEWWSTVEPLSWTISLFAAAVRWSKANVRPQVPAPNWMERLNQRFGSDYIIRGLLNQEPILQVENLVELSDEETQWATAFRNELKINDPVAILVPPTNWCDRPVVLRTKGTDYSVVCALDKLGRRPKMLSANALLFCPDTKELLLHRRSSTSRDYAELLHTFGGAYMPPGVHGRDYDHFSLVRTAMRETVEESGMEFDIAQHPQMLLGEENKIGFVNLVLLGVEVSRQTLELACSNHEGSISRLKAEEIPRRIFDDDWAASGKVHVLSWLALGAPVGRRRIRFDGESGQKLFNRLMPPMG